MNRSVAIISFAVLVAVGSSSMAQGPPGLTKKEKVPPGFDHGRKTGWQDVYPPGWDKKSKDDQEQWKQEVKKGRATISKYAKEKGLDFKDVNAAADDYEKAVRRGLGIEEASALTVEGITKGKKGHGLSVLVAEEAERLLDQESKKKDKGKSQGKGKPGRKE